MFDSKFKVLRIILFRPRGRWCRVGVGGCYF